jgi:phenylacetate-CoA ligase
MQKWPPVYNENYRPDPSSPYWFPDLETMDPAERDQTIILPKLQAQLNYAYKHSNLYRKKWDAALQRRAARRPSRASALWQ